MLHVGQPSVTVVGVGELLFGKASPAGRTVQTVYEAAYADQVSIFDFNMRPGPSAYVVFGRILCAGAGCCVRAGIAQTHINIGPGYCCPVPPVLIKVDKGWPVWCWF